MKLLSSNSISTCITDPPYNYEFVGKSWNEDEIKRRLNKAKDNNSSTLVKNLPYGSGLSGGVRNERWYKKNRDNIIEYQKWCESWAKELYRVLKNGSLCFVFNSSRTIAHVQIAFENVGFYTKDIIVYRRNSGIPKGLNVSKKLQKLGYDNYYIWDGWHSCLRNEWEAILIVQKPLLNNHIETLMKNNVGLLYTKTDEGFMSNVIENVQRDKKDDYNTHPTVKPIELIKKLIHISTPNVKGNIVIDPFMGSGTTAIASEELGINYIGFELSGEYCNIAEQRIKQLISI